MQDKYAGLNEPQRQAVFQTEGPVLILAGAGSGKTRVLTHRINYLVEEMKVYPSRILAITFTNKAAKEMQERASSLIGENIQGAWICTFHSACIRILKQWADRIGYDKHFTIYDPEDQKAVIRRILKEMNISDKMFTPKAILSAISNAKDELKGPQAYLKEVGNGDLFKKKTALVYEQYQKNLLENQAMDFDDIIVNTVRLFQTNADVLDYYQEKFRYLMVDEYQDTNTAQYMLIRLLADKYRNLCVVGDDDQSIYRFRGANIRNILDFEKDFPDALVIWLEQNYRSTGKILNAANHVIRNNDSRKEKTLWTSNGEGEDIIVHESRNENEESAYVVQQMHDFVENGTYHYRDMACLYRTNAQSRALEERLVLSAIPYRLYGGTPFYQRREVKDVLCYLRLIANDHDYVASDRIINVPARGIGQVSSERVREFAQEAGFGIGEVCEMAGEIPDLRRAGAKLQAFGEILKECRHQLEEGCHISSLIKTLLKLTDYPAFLRQDDPVKYEDRMENIDELSSRADQYEQENEEASLDGFLDELSLVAAIDEFEEGADVVSLMTLHSAKGLEFPVVFMMGMEDGTFPGFQNLSSPIPEDMEEERRLCYVGITRAKERLFMTMAKTRHVHGAIADFRPSCFLRELPNDIVIHEEDDDAWAQPDPDESFYSRRVPGHGLSGRREWTNRFREESNPYLSRPASSYGVGDRPEAGSSAVTGKASQIQSKGPAIQDPPAQVERLEVGDTVMHKAFGLGIVKEVRSVNADYQVRVDFAKKGEKLLFAKMAGLKKVK
ncbi:MAG: UvrD-helicase domain-containing protein [Firmicutes bacterium]|nr:UvrD-helicase domain-containing protein [Bacillota bacterium]